MDIENQDGISKILMRAAEAVSKNFQESSKAPGVDEIFNTLELFKDSLLHAQANVVETRPEVLACDVVRFQNNKDKWVAFVGLLNGHPYEIFTGLQDDDEGILLPKTVTKGKIIKVASSDGTKRYDFQFENKRGYKTTVEGLSEKFDKEYWNYAKLISGVLRYRMPIEHVIKLVSQLQLTSESINTWKVGVERALKKYLNDSPATSKEEGTETSKEENRETNSES